MKEQLKYRVDSKLKEEYNKFITEKYGSKLGTVGNKIEKAMKLQLTMEGYTKYENEPDIQALIKTNIPSKSNDSPIEERLEKIEESIVQIENRTRRESSKKHGHAEFKKQFTMAFNDHQQISRKDLERFIMNHSDIVDKRSVQGRIHYLESHGMIESYAPNVYTLILE